MKPDILYEDSQILVCRKPAGTATQTNRIGTPDMVSILKNHLFHSASVKKAPYLSVIHRLDQPVEGLLVFAKTPAAARSLNQQLTSSGFGKHYLALLNGVPTPEAANLDNYIIKDSRTNTSRLCTFDTPGAKSARLHYQVLCTHSDTSLAKIILDTGRHHQIRVQMAGINCPVMGDVKYGTMPASRQTQRLQLYAFRLSFCHPHTRAPLTFTYIPQLAPPFDTWMAQNDLFISNGF